MSYEMTGTVKKVMDLQVFDTGFTKKQFVITTDDQYPQDVQFDTVKDKTSLCDKLKVGQKVTVSFDVRGNEYNHRFYVNLNCWKINAEESQESKPAQKGEESEGDTPF